MVPLATPPEETVSVPPDRVAPKSVPKTVSEPPVKITVPLAVPPAATISLPPDSVAPMAMPPE